MAKASPNSRAQMNALVGVERDVQSLYDIIGGLPDGSYRCENLGVAGLTITEPGFANFVRARRPEGVSKNAVSYFLGDLASEGVTAWERLYGPTADDGYKVEFGLYVPTERTASDQHLLSVRLARNGGAVLTSCQVEVRPLQWDAPNQEWIGGEEFVVHDVHAIAEGLGRPADRLEAGIELVALSGIMHRTLEIVQTAVAA